MIKFIFLFSLSILLYNFPSEKKIVVTDRIKAIRIYEGYSISENDNTFLFDNKKYLIQTEEIFDENGNIISTKLLKDIGYLDFSKVEMEKLKNFYEKHNFSRNIEAFVIENKYLRINGKKFLISSIDEERKKVFYCSTVKKDILYYLSYK